MTHANKVAATVLMSGGIDSTACAHFLQQQGTSVSGLFIDHGQAAAACEIKAVDALASHLGIRIERFVLSGPRGFGTGELVGRNAMLIFAALFLTRARPGLLVTGIHGGTSYFDCSKAFFESTSKLVSEHTDGRVCLIAPFLDWSKKDVFDYFFDQHLPLDLTYSCEAGGEPVCGTCASCRDRRALT